MKTKLRNQKGFTIIEVLIVLAIAGLILLIVFLAVPALQRNSRNTQRKNDIAALGGAINEYTNNNNGTQIKDQATLGTAAGNAKLGIYAYSTSTVVYTSPAATVANPDDITKIYVVVGAKCSTGGAATNSGAASREVALLYTVESGSGKADICQEA